MPNRDEDADASAEGAIDQFVVDPAAQHQGHGSRLLNASADTRALMVLSGRAAG
jgi:ribosomal protein S18 acetylase RimI-like enzyme